MITINVVFWIAMALGVSHVIFMYFTMQRETFTEKRVRQLEGSIRQWIKTDSIILNTLAEMAKKQGVDLQIDNLLLAKGLDLGSESED